MNSKGQVVYESTRSDLCRLDCGFGEPLHSFVGSFLATLDPGGTIVTPLEPSGCNPSSFAVDVARVDESTLAVGMGDQVGLDWSCFEGTPRACEMPCLGDLDGLNGVGFQDLLIVLNGWTDAGGCLGTVVGPPSSVAECIEILDFAPTALAAPNKSMGVGWMPALCQRHWVFSRKRARRR